MKNKSKKVMKKLQGLKANEVRLYYVQLGGDYDNGGKLYFETQDEAIHMFKAISLAEPIVIATNQIYSWNHKEVEEELKEQDLDFAYIKRGLIVSVGSEVKKVFETESEMKKARKLKEEEIEKLKKAKKEGGAEGEVNLPF